MTSEPPVSPATASVSRKATRDRIPIVELVAVGAIPIAGVVVAVAGGSTVAVVLVVITVAVLSGVLLLRSVTDQRRLVRRMQSQFQSEVDQWRHRWQSLQQEAQQTNSSLALMRDGVIMLSRTEKILLINPAARRLLTLSPQGDVLGRPLGEVVRIPELSRAVAAAGAGDGTQKVLLEVPDGEIIRPVKVRVDRFTTGGEVNLLMALRDETNAHRIESMRREFIANISHELKTPLAAIKGYAETVELAIKDDPDAAVHFMTQINSQCLRLERLIADMMQLARAQSSRGQLDLSPVSLKDVVAEALKSYRPVAEAKEIELTADTSVEAKVWSDPEATLTIVNNLIGNAVHYTPQGGKVQVYCREAGKYWALVVEDTGVGIPQSEQKRIFERFYRIEKGRHSGDGGTGIGLSIVKNLTTTLGGEVRLTSKPGLGSTFEVLLPSEDQSRRLLSNQPSTGPAAQ